MIERQIAIGLITSTEYLRQIQSIWNVQYIETSAIRRIMNWCWEYFDKYDQAPNKDIIGIFYANADDFDRSDAREIEEHILDSLSEEHAQQDFNLEYLLTETRNYFQRRQLEIHHQRISGLLSKGDLTEATQVATDFRTLPTPSATDLHLADEESLPRVEQAFSESVHKRLIEYPGALGALWNDQMVRGAFVALVGIEKRGKTFWLLDLAMRACRQRRQVAFFQAGDMTESQQLKRIGSYVSRKPLLKKYAGEYYRPIRDCVLNQLDECDEECRECDHGIWERLDIAKVRREIEYSDLRKAYKDFPEYVPCTACSKYKTSHWGVPWLQPEKAVDPLSNAEAIRNFRKWFVDRKRQFMLSTHANGTLSVKQIKAKLAIWERQSQFVPDVIVIDYADLLIPESRVEFRHQQNEIWKQLRNLSQEKGQPLVITATQADADAYDKARLRMKNFSEDKRKNAHVTAMYGLNQDAADREKRLRLMRINEIVVREGGFSSSNEVTVLQNLERGQPFVGSYL